MLVLDASFVYAFALTGESFDEIPGGRLLGPPLLWSEVASTIRQATWRGALSDSEGRETLATFLAAPIERRSSDDLYVQALAIATQLGWAKTYDAEYLALARIEGCRLLTRDARLQRGAERIVQIVGPSEL